MTTDLFRHKIINRPSLEALLLLINPLEETSIPKDGQLDPVSSASTYVALTECDGMIVDNKHTMLLGELLRVCR